MHFSSSLIIPLILVFSFTSGSTIRTRSRLRQGPSSIDRSRQRDLATRADFQEGSVKVYRNDDEFYVKATIDGRDFDLQLDTGSSGLWVFSSECKLSPSWYGWNAAKSPKLGDFGLSYLDQSSVCSSVHEVDVKVGGIVANGLNIGAADAAIGRIGELKYPYDGILGLGFDPDTSVVRDKDPFITAITTKTPTLTQPLFTIALDDDLNHPHSSCTFGFIPSDYPTDSISYTSIIPDHNTWTVRVTGWSFGDQTFEGPEYQPFQAEIDTGTNFLLLPDDMIHQYFDKLGANAKYIDKKLGYVYKCGMTLPDISFNIGQYVATVQGSSLTGDAAGKISGVNVEDMCYSTLRFLSGIAAETSSDRPGVLGVPFFYTTFTVFEKQPGQVPRIGFARKSPRSVVPNIPKIIEPGAGDCSGAMSSSHNTPIHHPMPVGGVRDGQPEMHFLPHASTPLTHTTTPFLQLEAAGEAREIEDAITLNGGKNTNVLDRALSLFCCARNLQCCGKTKPEERRQELKIRSQYRSRDRLSPRLVSTRSRSATGHTGTILKRAEDEDVDAELERMGLNGEDEAERLFGPHWYSKLIDTESGIASGRQSFSELGAGERSSEDVAGPSGERYPSTEPIARVELAGELPDSPFATPNTTANLGPSFVSEGPGVSGSGLPIPSWIVPSGEAFVTGKEVISPWALAAALAEGVGEEGPSTEPITSSDIFGEPPPESPFASPNYTAKFAPSFVSGAPVLSGSDLPQSYPLGEPFAASDEIASPWTLAELIEGADEEPAAADPFLEPGSLASLTSPFAIPNSTTGGALSTASGGLISTGTSIPIEWLGQSSAQEGTSAAALEAELIASGPTTLSRPWFFQGAGSLERLSSVVGTSESWPLRYSPSPEAVDTAELASAPGSPTAGNGTGSSGGGAASPALSGLLSTPIDETPDEESKQIEEAAKVEEFERLSLSQPTGGAPQGGAPQGGTPQGGTPQGGTPQGGTPQGGTPQGGSPSSSFATYGTPEPPDEADPGFWAKIRQCCAMNLPCCKSPPTQE